MDYFAYQSKRKSISHIKEFIENTPSSESSNSMPSTPTIFIHDAGKSPSKPTCIRYSASFFNNENTPNVLSTSLPSPPTTPHHQLPVLPSLSLSLPSPSRSLRRRFSNPPHTIHSPRLHILLVDDNAINLQILSRMLNLHMSVAIEHMELVKSGVKALEILKCRPFDLILMDIDMPIMNGIETTKHIRSSSEFDILPRNRKAPIVAVTTNDSSTWRATYKEIGMNGCIGKPISPNDLKKTLSRILDLHLPIPPYTPE
ncbi:sensitivity to red-light reduced protein [Mucor circinelloides]